MSSCRTFFFLVPPGFCIDSENESEAVGEVSVGSSDNTGHDRSSDHVPIAGPAVVSAPTAAAADAEGVGGDADASNDVSHGGSTGGGLTAAEAEVSAVGLHRDGSQIELTYYVKQVVDGAFKVRHCIVSALSLHLCI
jgi:hypothetical protein